MKKEKLKTLLDSATRRECLQTTSKIIGNWKYCFHGGVYDSQNVWYCYVMRLHIAKYVECTLYSTSPAGLYAQIQRVRKSKNTAAITPA